MKPHSPDYVRTILLCFLIATLGLIQPISAAQPQPVRAAPQEAPQRADETHSTQNNSIEETPAAAEPQQTDPTPQKMLDQSAWEAWQTLPLEYKRKVDPRLLAELAGDVVPAHLGSTSPSADTVGGPLSVGPAERQPLSETRFVVHLRSAVDLDELLQTRVFASAVEQRSAVFRALVSESQSSQTAVVAALESELAAGNVSGYQSFFIVNALAVDGGLSTIVDLARRFDVERIAANYPLVSMGEGSPAVRSVGPRTAADVETELTIAAAQQSNVEWNIELVRADDVWLGLGVNGTGAVVAGFDTGVDYNHPALVNSYRGTIGGDNFDHNYNWFEPDGNLYPDGNLGRSVSDTPYDCSSHGTHTMGTSVGGTVSGSSFTSQVGVAPGAKWIALPGICYNTMSGGIGDDIGGIKAFQWLLCPTDLSGDLSTADCAKAPHAVNNSWGSANPVDDTFRPIIQALRAAGIAPVFAAGNPSAGAGAIGAPANIPEAITVGATDSSEQVAYFSARGPSFYAGEQKPELSAPGVDVYSTVPGGGYSAYSGTSMAAPHVTGLIALMVSADLRDGVRDFSVDELERFMIATAVDLGEPGPDNDYGYGRINAYEAVRAVLTAGDLRGNVIDAETGEPVVEPLVTSLALDSSSRFTAQGLSPASSLNLATGSYSLTVPAGNYNITVDAWGYKPKSFPGQSVFADTLSLADFALAPLPRRTVSGQMRTGAAAGQAYTRQPAAESPVAGARIAVLDSPGVEAITNEDGTYTLDLPVGTHTLQVEAVGHRIFTETLKVEGTNITLNLALPAAPAILLIDGSAFEGWFTGWPIYPFFQQALERSGYQSILWRIEDPTITDTAEESGTTVYGVPSFETLNQYDVVIWMQSGCGYCYVGTPKELGAEAALVAYLETGGRLILSGQDLGYRSDGNSTLYDEYLLADLNSNYAASEGGGVSGADFLDDLELEITNAAVYGYANGSIDLSPDSVSVASGSEEAFPVLTYDNGAGSAALAVNSCEKNHRAIYIAAGYENMGPRADNRTPDFAAVMARSLDWLGGVRPQQDLELRLEMAEQVVTQGKSAFYQVKLINSGQVPLQAQLSLNEINWNTTIVQDAAPQTDLAGSTMELAPCQAVELTLAVEVPDDAANGAADELVLRATGTPLNDGTGEVVTVTEVRTLAFTDWRLRTLTGGVHEDLSVAAPGGDIYVHAMGGYAEVVGADGYAYLNPSTWHERYNPCTDGWEPAASLPSARAEAASATVGDQVYLIGGLDEAYYPASSMLVYDRSTDAWSEAPAPPITASDVAAAAAGGKIYIFGGSSGGEYVNRTYMYDPSAGTWLQRASMPSERRPYAAAATLNGKIYVAGGWPTAQVLEIYDPATNKWSTGADLLTARSTLSLVAAPDGYLYAVGAGGRFSTETAVERYSPQTDTWEYISSLHDGVRSGGAAAFAAGQIFMIGGEGQAHATESLALDTSFCLSSKTVDTDVTQPGGQLVYSVNLLAQPDEALTVRVRDSLPDNSLFGGFVHNPLGAVYDGATHQIRWNGTLAADSAPASYSYSVLVGSEGWSSGDPITGTVRLRGARENQAALRFDRSTTSRVYQPDFSASSLESDHDVAVRSERLRYTVELQSRTAGGGPIQLHDALPPGLSYVPDSLQAENGTGGYDPATRSINWSGQVQPGQGGLFNDTGDYAWIDSDGNQSLEAPGISVPHVWNDIRTTGNFVTTGDDLYFCNLPIGFAFPYYGVEENRFCVSTNGFVSFDEQGYSNLSYSCLPTSSANGATIAGWWTDLVVYGGVYYQTVGSAPDRSLIVQWTDAPYYYSFSGASSTFQVILHENGTIDVQMLEIDTVTDQYGVVGVSDHTNTQGNTYHCGTSSGLENESAVRFVPPNSSLGGARTEVSFDVTVDADTPVNSQITNTITITGSSGSYQRSLPLRLNTLSLATSRIDVPQEPNNGGEPVALQFVVRNTGQLTATNASLIHPLGVDLSYVADSVTCGRGECVYQNGEIRWHGAVPAKGQTVVRYQAIPDPALPDRASIRAAAQVNDGHGSSYNLQNAFVTRSSDLTASTVRMVPPFIEPGANSTYELFVHNTGAVETTSNLAVPLPDGLTYVEGSLICGTGSCSVEGGTIRWSGTVAARSAIPIRFTVASSAEAPYGRRYSFESTLADDYRSESLVVNGSLTLAHNTHLSVLFIPSQGITLYMPFMAQEEGQ